MQVILDSLFARPSSAPIWRREERRVQGLDYWLPEGGKMALFCWLAGLPAVTDGLFKWPGRTVRGGWGRDLP